MSKDIINFDAIKLTTELNKYKRHKAIPNTFFDGTYTILDVRELYNDLSLKAQKIADELIEHYNCLLYTSPSPRDRTRSRMPSSA